MDEFDTVKLNCDFHNLPAGTEGAIVHKYNEDDFEVEFFYENGRTIDVVTTPRRVLTLVHKFQESAK